MMLPNECKAYLFEQEGGELRKGMRKLPQLKEYEVLIKVFACSMNSTDDIGRFGLLPEVRYPNPPGASVVGKVVGCGQKVASLESMGGAEKIKEGSCVAGLPMYGGLSEYVVCDARLCTEPPKEWRNDKKMALEACSHAWIGGRVHCAALRFCEQHERMSKSERELCEEKCREMGYKGQGVFAVYGEGGAARLALDMLKALREESNKMMMHGSNKKCRIVLVTPTSKWSADDYGMKKEDVLRCDKDNVAKELKEMGGVWWIAATEMPSTKAIDHVLDAMRYNSQLVLLNPRRNHRLELPVGQLIAKNISVCGAPLPQTHDLRQCLELCHRAHIKVSTHCVDFHNENEVRSAWRAVEEGNKFDAEIVEVCRFEDVMA
ncbi:hypothetical protein JCM6882_001372 [Rhodosporidiobolus microsporus]